MGVALLFLLPLVGTLSSARDGNITLVFAEVTVIGKDGESRTWYVALPPSGSLSLALNEGDAATVRVDSTSPLKPVRVMVSGPPTCRAAIIEDVVVAYASGHCSLTIIFGAREPKPPVYMLRVGEIVEIRGGEPVELAPHGEWRPWGAFLRVLTLEGEPRIKAGGPVSLLNRSLHKITTSIGEVEAEERVYLVLAGNFSVEGTVLSAAFSPIYYKPLEGLGKETTLTMSTSTVLYINEPCFARVYVEPVNATTPPFTLLSKFLADNPRVVSVVEGAKVSVMLEEIVIKLPARYADFFVETEEGNRNPGEIEVTPSLGEAARVRVLTPWGDLVGEYEVLSYAPEIEVPVTLHTLEIHLLDSEGEELGDADVVLYRALRMLTVHANESVVFFRDLPQGDYVVVVKYMGVEVARKLYSLERDSRLTLRCNVRPLELRVTLADGTLPEEFEVLVRGVTYRDLSLRVRGVNGSLITRPLPIGVYQLEVLVGNAARGTLEVDLSKQGSYLLALPVRPVVVRVLSVLGTPLKGVRVSLESNGKEVVSAYTNDEGKAFFSFVEDGTYLVKAEVGGVKASREVRVTGPDRIHVTLWLDVLILVWGVPITPSLAAITAAIMVITAIAITWRRRQRDIIIIETERRPAFDHTMD